MSEGRGGAIPPFVSVILPVRNEEAYIGRALDALLAQDYPDERTEILVVDGRSTDRTREIVEEIAARQAEPTIRIVDNPEEIAATALNRGLGEARGTIIARVDGHCEVGSGHLSTAVEIVTDGRADCVGGPVETVGETPTARAIAAAMASPFGVGDSAFRVNPERRGAVDTVPFPAFRRQVLDLAGPFDEELVRNQDDEYSFRLRKLGFRVLLEPRMKSRYYSRGTLGSLWSQYLQYGYWKVRVLQKHPAQMRWRHFVPGAFVLTLLLATTAAVWSPWPVVALVGLYLLAVGWATLDTARTFGVRRLWVLPAAFAALHVGYGTGFLAGLVRFAGRWRTP